MPGCSFARPDPARCRDERASGVVLVAVVLAIVLVALAVVVSTAHAARARAEAQTAADAVALAVAAGGPERADVVAAANRATIVALESDERGVTVTVEHAGVRASARAARVECRGSCTTIP